MNGMDVVSKDTLKRMSQLRPGEGSIDEVNRLGQTLVAKYGSDEIEREVAPAARFLEERPLLGWKLDRVALIFLVETGIEEIGVLAPLRELLILLPERLVIGIFLRLRDVREVLLLLERMFLGFLLLRTH